MNRRKFFKAVAGTAVVPMVVSGKEENPDCRPIMDCNGNVFGEEPSRGWYNNNSIGTTMQFYRKGKPDIFVDIARVDPDKIVVSPSQWALVKT